MRYKKNFWVIAAVIMVLVSWSPEVFSQYDYVPGMENFPDVDIISYDLRAEFYQNVIPVNAKAIVEFQMEEERSDIVIFEIDRRVRISNANNGEGNPLKFRQPEDSDYVVIYLTNSLKKKERARIELDYVCNFPPLWKAKSQPESAAEPRQGLYFFLRKWYPVNDYYCDQASADFTFTTPRDYEILTSGQEISTAIQGERKISRWRSFGLSNYYFVFAGPFIRYTYEDQVPRIVICMDTEEPDVAKAANKKALDIIQYYGEMLCPYPYPVLYLVTSHSKTRSMGLNGLTYIDSRQFSQVYIYSDWTWSHELAHHWFGGAVRSKTPEDYCFLIESPAEYLSRSYIRSTKGEKRFRIDLDVQRMAALGGNEITPITKFYALGRGGEFLYAKGFYIFHMLRHIMGDDNFFTMMRNLVRNFYMKPAGISDLQNLAEKTYSQSLRWFFDQWVHGTGIPEYELTYHVDPKENGRYEVSGLIRQKQVKFRMPVEIVAMSRERKYTHKVLVKHQKNPFHYKVSFKPDTVLLDPEFKVLRWDEDIKAWLYTVSGRKLMIRRDYKEATRLLDSALEINPRCTWAALERGNVAYIQGKYEIAVQYYTQALNGDLDFRMTPWPPEQIRQRLHLLLGISYDLVGKRQEAVACYQRVVEMGRNSRYPTSYDKAKEYIEKPASIKK